MQSNTDVFEFTALEGSLDEQNRVFVSVTSAEVKHVGVGRDEPSIL